MGQSEWYVGCRVVSPWTVYHLLVLTVRIQAGQVAAGRSGEYVFLGQMVEECPVTPQCSQVIRAL